MSVVVLCFVVRCFIAPLPIHDSGFAVVLVGRGGGGLVALLGFVFQVSRNCCVALLRGTTGLSAVCNWGIS